MLAFSIQLEFKLNDVNIIHSQVLTHSVVSIIAIDHVHLRNMQSSQAHRMGTCRNIAVHTPLGLEVLNPLTLGGTYDEASVGLTDYRFAATTSTFVQRQNAAFIKQT